MKSSRHKVLEEISSFSSYILIQTNDKPTASLMPLQLSDDAESSFNYSVSTLILPTREPLLITVGYFLFPLLLPQELKDLNNNQFLPLDYDRLKQKIRFYLYHNEKIDSNNEGDKENYIELVPSYLLLSKDLTTNFSEIFKYKSKQSNTIPSEAPDDSLDAYEYSKYFSLMVLESTNPGFFPSKLRYSHILNTERPSESEKVYIVSSPFALASPILYKNTVQVSQICKVACKGSKKTVQGHGKNYIFLTNGASKEGEEGSPVYNREFQVIGLTLGNISPFKQDLTGFTVCIGTPQIMDLLLRTPETNISADIYKINTSKYKTINKDLPIKLLLPRIVKVVTGTMVGSGIILNQHGYILTNKHVIEGSENQKITIEFHDNNEYEYYAAEVFMEAKGNLDIALLKVPKGFSNRTLRTIKATSQFIDHSLDVRYLQGNKVYAAGYTFAHMKSLDFKVIATQGYLSKIIVYKNDPFLIATTCPVYNGFSGGAIISEKGHFLGLITYNFTHSNKGILNDFNYSYCSHMFKNMLDKMDGKNDNSVKESELWELNDGYIQKLTSAQTIEYVPSFEFKSKL